MLNLPTGNLFVWSDEYVHNQMRIQNPVKDLR